MASASRRFGSSSQPLAFSADPKTSTARAMTASASMRRFYQPCSLEFTCTGRLHTAITVPGHVTFFSGPASLVSSFD